ncbi:very short patch repair endonuclease [Caulobacter sp. 17J65-9]|uniref:very short patch repair endonuclease n=1 Tax=Caulobacter sp. 17J65-9 TaxID=2709382 RepID=UPI0013C5E970|nr:very short patch repair endonuclease [Caulobacter sp. 17J65-9]NEX92973.1 DNA mismatch endonuclease Vsr [Caulobacter sp. 17J65-9]
MADVVDSRTRSRMMAGIRGRDTTPELLIRRALHRAGFRFRLNVRSLPGTPDIVLPKYRAAIFIHGCFWHRHEGCRYATHPATRPEFWAQKFQQNVERDARARALLKQAGWRVATIWECGTRKLTPSASARLFDWVRSSGDEFVLSDSVRRAGSGTD